MVRKVNESEKKKQRVRKNAESPRHEKQEFAKKFSSPKLSSHQGEYVASSHDVTTKILPSASQHNTLLIQFSEDEPVWYQIGKKQSGRNDTILTSPPPVSKNRKFQVRNTPEMITKYRSLADSIYRREIELFDDKRSGSRSNSDDRWVESTIRKGTLKDRIAAMSLLVSTNPVHKFFALDGLLQLAGCSESNTNNIVKSTNSRVAQLAAEALEDLFVNTFIPSDRKLLTLAQRPLYLFEPEIMRRDKSSVKQKAAVQSLSPRILLLWRFEEMVKSKYLLFLQQYLSNSLQVGMEQDKMFAVRCSANLLRSLPEGEAIVLQMIVNKLGDPSKKVAALAAHELRKVLQQHPVMQVVIAREVQQLAHRPRLSSRSIYNCIIFLNQLTLSHDDDAEKEGRKPFPTSLVSTYFRLFEVAVNNKLKDKNESEVGKQNRLLSALLSGVNRAHPYLPKKDQDLEEHIDSLYRIVHTSPPATSTQALLLLFYVAVGSKVDDLMDKKEVSIVSDDEQKLQGRFYRALYAAVARPGFLRAGKHSTMFFNLLYKAMKYDTDTNRVIVFCKRIMCMTIHSQSPVAAAGLFLLNEIVKYHPALQLCFAEILRGPDALRVLDPSKREPTGALILPGEVIGNDQYLGEERKAPSWELALTAHHFHPSVAKFTSCIGNITYTGDPLRDFALIPFLDKFAYRNPKSADHVASKFRRGESVAERKTGRENAIKTLSSLPVNDPSFALQTNVDAQDEFFHRFFVERERRDKVKGIERQTLSSDAEGGDDMAALEAAEEAEIDGTFEDFQDKWETDSEEEAFVDSLAEGIMEDNDNNLVDLDDEDSNMSGWDEEDLAAKIEVSTFDGVDDSIEGSMVDDRSDDDVFANNSELEEHEDNNDDDGNAINDSDDDAFMDDDDDNSADGSEELQTARDRDVTFVTDHFDHNDSDNESIVLLDDDNMATTVQKKVKSNVNKLTVLKTTKKSKLNDSATFVSIDKFEAVINDSWQKLTNQKDNEEMKHAALKVDKKMKHAALKDGMLRVALSDHEERPKKKRRRKFRS